MQERKRQRGFSLEEHEKKWLACKYLGFDDNQKLLAAVENGNIKECNVFIHKAKVNFVDNRTSAGGWKGKTALYLAVSGRLNNSDKKEDFEDIITLLMDHGANLDISCVRSENIQETVEELIARTAVEEDDRNYLLQLLGKHIKFGYPY